LTVIGVALSAGLWHKERRLLNSDGWSLQMLLKELILDLLLLLVLLLVILLLLVKEDALLLLSEKLLVLLLLLKLIGLLLLQILVLQGTLGGQVRGSDGLMVDCMSHRLGRRLDIAASGVVLLC
jgi:hypothetical protein